jgi:hypothetical protein
MMLGPHGAVGEGGPVDTSEVGLVRTSDRGDLATEASELFREHWPEYIFHDSRVAPLLPSVRRHFSDWDFFALDADGRLVGACYGVPLRWDRSTADLPEGYTDALSRSLADHEQGIHADTFVILGAVVRRDEAGKGWAGRILTALRERAVAAGMGAVIAPVRPTTKSRYPLAGIEDFARWTREDGLPLDPWLRAHVRLGATVLCGAERSQTMVGTVAEWESWTDLALPVTGEYVIPDGLALLSIDREADRGVYHDPNVWMRHV